MCAACTEDGADSKLAGRGRCEFDAVGKTRRQRAGVGIRIAYCRTSSIAQSILGQRWIPPNEFLELRLSCCFSGVLLGRGKRYNIWHVARRTSAVAP